jgi:hypothetical protein
MDKILCEHVWEEYDDQAAYNDGFNCSVVEICKICGARVDIRHKYAKTNNLKWLENLFLIPFSILVILYLVIAAPIIFLIVGIKEAFGSKTN